LYFHHKFDHVFEGAPPPRVTFIVCALPRSGSSLLCELLALSELAGAPSEVFDQNQMLAFQREWGTESFPDYLDALIRKKTSLNGVFGIKAHYHQLAWAFGAQRDAGPVYPHDVDGVFPNLHLVYIRRRDHIRQAVSFARATQTEQWTSGQKVPKVPPAYDREQIGSLLAWIEREEVAWENYFSECDAPLHRVVYEDFIEAIGETVREVMRFLGIDLPANAEVSSGTLERQADELNDQWAERYSAEAEGDAQQYVR
jgi:LPS sulfotransferase NodH